MKRGVFWLMDGKLLTFPFDGSHIEGIAKSGNTYNHKKLWQIVRPNGCSKPYNYYPRGRVEITAKGKPLVYMNPNIDISFLEQIKIDFALNADVSIRYDKCYLDDGWTAE